MPDWTELQVPKPWPTPLVPRLPLRAQLGPEPQMPCSDGLPTQSFTNQSASPLPAPWASMGSSYPPTLLQPQCCRREAHVPLCQGLAHLQNEIPAQDFSIHTVGAPRRGCCSMHTAQGMLDTPPWYQLHPQTWHVQPTEWCIFPSTPVGCDWCCPSHGSWLGKASVQYLLLARGAPMCARDLGQARRHREDLAVQSPMEGFHCLVTALVAATLRLLPRGAALHVPLGSALP